MINATKHLILLSMPGLRAKDVDPAVMPTLYGLTKDGSLTEMRPTFPCVTSPVQASMLTGTPPSRHGIIANGFYHRDRRAVEFWVAHNDAVAGEFIWDAIKACEPDWTTAVWHAQNIKGATADWIVTPSPIHHPDGKTELWCYSKPEGLYQELLDEFGHFPLQHYWGPMAGIESSRWTLRAAARLARRFRPNFQFIYIPHLDYAAQKFGPASAQAREALTEIDHELEPFVAEIRAVQHDAMFLVAGEYALTEVNSVSFPNRILREKGWLSVREENGAEHLDLNKSRAFAMVDHQFAHIYFTEKGDAQSRERVEEVAALFRDVNGIDGVYALDERGDIGMDHARSGEIVLVANPDHWFAYYWWLDDKLAPPFAHTVDIHAKPGYDPCEMFIDPATRGIAINPGLVNGSHGAPAKHENQRGALICSAALGGIAPDPFYRDVDIKSICLELLGLKPEDKAGPRADSAQP